MSGSNIFWNLFLLIPASSFLCLASMNSLRERRWMALILYVFFYLICAVSMGGYLASIVANSFEQQLTLTPIDWVEKPIAALKVLSASAFVGILFSLGAVRVIAQIRRSFKKTGHQLATEE
tara:strand:+ start:1291 stop:1653 length:363 start_codon:yes stop_codon:yes gene_type:complete